MSDLGRELVGLSKSLMSVGREEEALAEAERAEFHLSELYEASPSNAQRFQELYYARCNLSAILRILGREPEATDVDQRNKHEFAALIGKSPRFSLDPDELLSLTLHQGFSVEEAKELLQEFEEAKELLQELKVTDEFDSLHSHQDVPSPTCETTHSIAPPDASEVGPAADLFADMDNRYRLIGMLGRGGLGSVYSAYDNLLCRLVALKTVPDIRSSHDDSLGEHLTREAIVQGALHHENIVPLFDFGFKSDGIPFSTMKIVEGRDWRSLARDRPAKKREKQAYWRQALGGFAQVCDAIHHAHETGVLHGDPKPSNVIVDSTGKPWLIDWGLSRVLRKERFPKIENKEVAETVLRLPAGGTNHGHASFYVSRVSGRPRCRFRVGYLCSWRFPLCFAYRTDSFNDRWRPQPSATKSHRRASQYAARHRHRHPQAAGENLPYGHGRQQRRPL